LNFLAHLLLAGDDEGLRLGAMLGDFVRGNEALARYDAATRLGIRLHRHIDASTDSLPAVRTLLTKLQSPFRRYGGIIIDLAFDHELAKRWTEYSDISLHEFDLGVRAMMKANDDILPERLRRFMLYAGHRDLFASYREESEILHSLRGVGKRLSRANPLHCVNEIWDGFQPAVAEGFGPVFSEIQSDVDAWLKSKSTITGS
jgi:acyl carrier protein phosphodiesterase